jgi:drug/metabolite transporter (DMT)-like permease
MIPAFLATLLFACSVVFANRTTRLLGGVTANFYRLCVATVLLAAWAHVFGQGLGGNAFGWFFLSGVIGFGIGDLALYQALPRVGPRLSVLLVQCLAAPFAAVAEWMWMGTRLTPAQLLAGVVILTGVAVAVSPKEHPHLPRGIFIAGVCFGVLAACGQGMGAVVSRKAYTVVAASGAHVDGLTAAYQRIMGGMLFAIAPSLWVMLRSRVDNPGSGSLPTPHARGGLRSAWGWVLLNALAGPALGVGCYQWALATTPSGLVLPIVATTPIAVIPLAWWLEGDRPGLRSLAGGVVAVAGVILLTWAR